MSANMTMQSSAPSPELRSKSLLLRLAAMRAWLFLAMLLIVFEAWAWISAGQSFVYSAWNWQSIGIAAVAPLLLALGSTFVIISGGIDLSIGFIMGLAAVVAAHVTQKLGLSLPLFPAMVEIGRAHV